MIDKEFDFGTLPDKEVVLNWVHEPSIKKLMYKYKWPKKIARQWFQDLMCWLYSAQRWKMVHKAAFNMDGMHYLDDVWHEYILSTKDYFKMSRELFDIQYLHHNPENPYNRPEPNMDELVKQLEFLMEDWGEEYVDRVWAYGADLSDIHEQEKETTLNSK